MGPLLLRGKKSGSLSLLKGTFFFSPSDKKYNRYIEENTYTLCHDDEHKGSWKIIIYLILFCINWNKFVFEFDLLLWVTKSVYLFFYCMFNLLLLLFLRGGSFNMRISEIFQCHPCLLCSSLQENFSANTNILYVDLASAELVGSSKNENSLPGMVLNTKKPVVYEDAFGNRNRYILSSIF